MTIYALYGETGAVEDPEFIHIEDIRTRSRLYEWRISAHAHQRMFQVVHIASGNVEIRLEDKAATLMAPCAITIPPGAVHSFSFQPDTVGHVLTVADTLLLQSRHKGARALYEPLLNQPTSIDLSTAPEADAFLRALLAEMTKEFLTVLPGRGTLLDLHAQSVLLTLSRQIAMAQPREGRRGRVREAFSQFLKRIEDNYRRHLAVTDYAAMLAMSPARLNRLCRTVAGKPAQDVIHARLVLEARRLLMYTSATATEIAYELGFQDPAYFTRFFRQRTGQTPNAFRQSGQ